MSERPEGDRRSDEPRAHWDTRDPDDMKALVLFLGAFFLFVFGSVLAVRIAVGNPCWPACAVNYCGTNGSVSYDGRCAQEAHR